MTSRATRRIRVTTAAGVMALVLAACGQHEGVHVAPGAVDGVLAENTPGAGTGTAAAIGGTAGTTGQSVPGGATGTASLPATTAPSGTTAGTGSPPGTSADSGAAGAGTSGSAAGGDSSSGSAPSGGDGTTGESGGGVSSDQGSGPEAEAAGAGGEPITIGFQNSEDLQSGFAAVGASGDAPNEREINQALVDWLNDNGGIAGREVVAIHHGTNSTSGTWSSQAQAACSTFTEDNAVFAVVSSAVGGDDSLLSCLGEKNTPLVELNLWLFDQPYFDEYPNVLYRPGKMRADAWTREYIDGLAKIGYFEGATVGLLRFDAPVFERLTANVLKPALEANGVELEEEAVIRSPSGVSDFGGMSGELNNAILRFRRAGVDHVLMLENAGIMPFFFMQQAESQGYRPTYGLTSTDIPQTLQGQVSPQQLSGSVGIGWTPPNDVGHDDHPGDNPNYTRCRQVMEEQGVATRTGFYIQSHCDAVFFLQAALEAAPEISRAGLRAGVDALGSSYLSPFTMGSSYGPGKHDGADVVRPFAFDDGCECFVYTHQPYRRR